MFLFKEYFYIFILINLITYVQNNNGNNNNNDGIKIFNENNELSDENLHNIQNQIEQNLKTKIRLLNTSSEIEESPNSKTNKYSNPKNKYKLKIDVEFNLDNNDDTKNPDKCPPTFDKEFYEFSVVENIAQLIEPIYVDDCDFGINGLIYLTTNNPYFVFKADKINRHSKVGIQMLRSYDYNDKSLTTTGSGKRAEKYLQFEITASSSNQSLNKHQTKAIVRVNIENKNEFMPEFVLPEPIYYLKDGMPTNEKQKIYSYKVPENKDFILLCKAIDGDKGLDGKLFYTTRYLDTDDTFTIETELEQSENDTSDIFRVKIPGRYLDSHSKVPIMFAVRVADYGSPKLNNEIIIYLRPQPVVLMPIYFEFEKYEFELVENLNYLEQSPFTIRLINDNILKSTIQLEELRDPLDFISFGIDDSNKGVTYSASNHEIFKYLSPMLPNKEGSKVNTAIDDIDSELSIILYLTDLKRDFDSFYVENNYSDIYHYRLKAYVNENPSISTIIDVYFKLKDVNDNAPTLISSNLLTENYINATLYKNFAPNTLININEDYSIMKYNDADFSSEFGVRSLYCYVNDTRFYVDYEFMSMEIDKVKDNINVLKNGISLLIRVREGHNDFMDESNSNGQTIFLNATCRDNFYNGNGSNSLFHSTLVHVQIVSETDSILSLEDKNIRRKPVFEHETYIFNVNESWTGFIGTVNASVKKIGNKKQINDYIVYSIEPNNAEKSNLKELHDFIELRNSNEIYLKKEFNFENVSQRIFDFNVIAYNHDNERDNGFKKSRTIKKHVLDKSNPLLKLEIDNDNFNAFYSKARVILLVNDLNDELPQFVPNSYKFNFYTNKIESGRQIGQVFGFDSDRDDWNNLTFEIDTDSNNDGKMFDIIKAKANPSNTFLNSQSAYITAKTEINPSNYELNIILRDGVNHLAKSRVLINFEKLDPPFPNLKWFENNTILIEDNIATISLDKNVLLSNKKNKLVSLNAKLDSTESYNQDQLRYKQLEHNPYFKVNDLNGEVSYTDDLIKEIERSTDDKIIDVFLQAYYTNGNIFPKKVYFLPEILNAKFVIKKNLDNDKKLPKFILPPNNHTLIDLDIEDTKNGIIDNLFKFLTVDSSDSTNNGISNKNVEYTLIENIILNNLSNSNSIDDDYENEIASKPNESNIKLNLPFAINASTGILSFDSSLLDHSDFLNLLNNNDFSLWSLINQDPFLHHTDSLKVRLKINAKDIQSKQNAFAYIFIKVDLKQLVDQFKLNVMLKKDLVSEITVSFDVKYFENNEFSLINYDPETRTYNFLLHESVQPNTVLAQLVTFINRKKTKHLVENYNMISDNSLSEKINPEAYLKYDSFNGTIKLIRKIDYKSVKSLNFSLVEHLVKGSNNISNKTSVELKNRQLNVCIKIKNGNNHPPNIKLNEEEMKDGQNIILLSVGDLKVNDIADKLSVVASSTPMPMREARPAIPELNLPSFPSDYPRPAHLFNELNENKKNLEDFNNQNVIKVYKIYDDDEEDDNANLIHLKAKFLPELTSKYVIENYKVETNGSHLIFSKKNLTNSTNQDSTSTSSSKNLVNNIKTNNDSEQSQISHKFSVELSDDKLSKTINGELFNIDPHQLQHMIVFEPINGRFQATLYRSSMHNTELEISPNIQIRNPFPFDLYLELSGAHAKYFRLSQTHLRQMSLINFLPSKITIRLIEPLENQKEIDFLTRMKFEIQIKSNNSYLNQLLNVIGNLKVTVDLLSENKYEPRIFSIEPDTKLIELDEGVYTKKNIAKIKAMDRDRGDPGRLEYFLLGSSLLTMNRTTGEVYLDGVLDAETEQQIKFYTYARDLAPKPFGMNSELIEFTIDVKDINEFKPLMQPTIMYVELKENDIRPIYPNSIHDFVLDCYDKDVNSALEIVLESIRYVNKHDTFMFMDDPDSFEVTNRHVLKDLFRLVYEEKSNLSLLNTSSIKNEILDGKHYTTYARLALKSSIDYERLYKPNETLIRIDLACTDGQFEARSKVLINIQDMNDNKPTFLVPNKNLTIRRSESNLLETLIQVKASDMDLSPQYGNESLFYTINYCLPNVYNIYIDQRTGQINSKLIIDLDSDEIIAKRKEVNSRLKSFYGENDNGAIAPHFSVSEEMRLLKNFDNFINNYNRITCMISVNDSFKQIQDVINPSLSDSMQLTILIDNVNDNAPEFDSENNYIIEVKEGEETRGIELLKIRVFDRDDATGLRCLFKDGFTFYAHNEPFELRTGHDKYDPHTAWCILKVKDDTFIDLSDISKKSSYLLEIMVSDTLPQPPVYPNKGSSSVEVRVNIKSVNKKPPLFVNGDEERFYVLDSIPPNTLIGTILATDFENPNPEQIRYEIEDLDMLATGAKDFKLVAHQNTTKAHWGSVGLFTKSKLNVSQSPYILSIVAYDGDIHLKDTLSSRKIVTIYVLNKGSMSVWTDSETGLPIDSYSVKLNEEVPPNTLVVKIKANIPDDYIYHNSRSRMSLITNEPVITYSLEDLNHPFYEIDALNGEIRTLPNSRLDYEEKDIHKIQLMRNVRVRATSQDGDFKYLTHVIVEIVDINDNNPVFEENLSNNLTIFNLIENTTNPFLPTLIGQVKAFDLDSGSNGIVNYKLDETSANHGDVAFLFQLDKESGNIWLRQSMGQEIDREKNETIKISLIGYDLGKPESLNSKLEIEVRILDINDNKPVFKNLVEKEYIEFTIEENTLEFKHTFEAYDLDFGSNATLFFYLDIQNKHDAEQITKKFRIDPLTGVIILNSPLDYEEKNMYEFDVVCSDSGVPVKLSSSIRVKVNVVDVNDNAPVFFGGLDNKKDQDRVYADESLFKNGYLIHKFKAVDLDPTEKYHNTSYKVKNVFKISSQFNREFVLADLKTKNAFVLNLKTGFLTYESEAKLEDSSLTNEYIIEVEAYDEDKPDELRNSFNFTIILLPSNNKLPIFEHNIKERGLENLKNINRAENVNPKKHFDKYLTIFRRSLDESKPFEYVVDVLKAVDPNKHGIKYFLDSVEPIVDKNNSNEASINLRSKKENDLSIPLNKLFKIGEEDGVLVTSQIRSAYKDDAYKLEVRAVSTLNESLSTETTLYVKIDTSVDSLFESHFFNVSINENSQPDIVVFKLNPINGQQRRLKYKFNAEYSTPEQVYNKWFKLNEFNGEILTKDEERIDYEKYKQVLLSIDVYDFNSIFIENVIVKININDLNDNKPQFDLSYKYEIYINEDDNITKNEDRLISVFKAFDLDGSYMNSKLEYSIEDLLMPKESNTITISTFKLVKMEENGLIGLYKKQNFELDRDNKLIGNKVVLIIKVEDQCIDKFERLSDKKEFTINLVDLNDNPPRILNENQANVIEIREDFSLAEPFFKIKATDEDEGANAQLVYEILKEQSILAVNKAIPDKITKALTKHVSVDVDGNFFLINPIDYEQERTIELTLKIFDKSSKPLSIIKNMMIKILNINDNYPQFDLSIFNKNNNGKCRFDVYEGELATNLIYKFNVTDLDLDQNKPDFEFKILEISTQSKQLAIENQFIIDPNTGELNLNGHLDREKIDNYKLTIGVKDLELFGLRLETKIDCFINVLDINDNKPVFEDNNLEKGLNNKFTILPLVNQITFINWFRVTDADIGLNGTVEFKLDSEDKNDLKLFKIDSNGYLTMKLSSSEKKNPDLHTTYNFKVIAIDMGNIVKQSTSLDVNIEINRNYFKFNQQENNKLDLAVENNIVSIDENSKNGLVVSKVSVVNSFEAVVKQRKDDKNIKLGFKLLTCNDTFSINEVTGVISVLNSTHLDYESVKEFRVVIEAMETVESLKTNDELTLERYGLTNLIVKLNNMNDNPAEFNEKIYTAKYAENVLTLPYELTVSSNFIKLTDIDLFSNIIPNDQLVPIDIRLNGIDSETFRLVKTHSQNTDAGGLIKNMDLIYGIEAIETLDAEQKSRYEFEISSWDGMFKTKSLIKIDILDLNDNAPVFKEKLYNFNCDENVPEKTKLGQVEATDLDITEENKKVYYKILTTYAIPNTHKNENKERYLVFDVFKIDITSGELSVINSEMLDRENILSFNITVMAYNIDGIKSDTCNVILKLNDLNDNTPKFKKSIYNIALREKTSVLPRVISKLKAIDYDLAENGTIRYKIDTINGLRLNNDQENNMKNENSTQFYINPITGELKLNAYVDMDFEENSNDKKSFEINIYAYDMGTRIVNKESCLVIVKFIDINDHQPQFNKLDPTEYNGKEIEFTFQENGQSLDKPLMQITAIDPDYSHNQIKYYIYNDLNNDWSFFTIDQNGHIFTNVIFDYETKHEYIIRVIAQDTGIMIDENVQDLDDISGESLASLNDGLNSYMLNLTSSLVVRIKVDDLDDNEPEFSSNYRLNETFTRNVSDTLEKGSTITVLPMALDRDSYQQNIDVKYFIVDGNQDGKFDLNETSAELILIDELDFKQVNKYELLIKATSKYTFNEIKSIGFTENDHSILKVVLNIVKDKLIIEFDEQNYYVSLQVNSTRMSNDNLMHTINMHKMSNQMETPISNKNNSFSDVSYLAYDENYIKHIQESSLSIFFARAHLKQRKLKRIVKFNVDLLQLIRFSEQSAVRLSTNLVQVDNFHQEESLDFNKHENSKYLFLIDINTGKVFANKNLISKSNYHAGDRFIITISALCHTNADINVDDENTLTHLTVRLTDKDYSFIMPINKKFKQDEIVFNYLNPLRTNYIPRVLETDGVKLSVQDLVVSKAPRQQFNNDNLKSEQGGFDLIFQVDTKQDHKQVNLDLFVNMWKNYSASNVFLKEFNNFIEREPRQNARRIESLDGFDSRPFYLNWLFWLLLIIGILLIIILIFFVCCIKLTRKQHKSNKQTGIIIEYPPGINPLYNDGVLNFNKSEKEAQKEKGRTTNTKTSRSKVLPVHLDENSPSLMMEYEDQELEMYLEESNASISQSDRLVIQNHHENK